MGGIDLLCSFRKGNGLKFLYALPQPVQYQSPLVRHLVAGGLDLEVVYARDEQPFFDPEFNREVAWDLPLREGYASTVLDGGGDRASLCRRLMVHARSAGAQAIWAHGWSQPMDLAAWDVAARLHLPLLIRGDSTLQGRRGGPLRRWLHRQIYRRRFRRVAACLAVGSWNADFYRAYGVTEERIFSVPYAVDNVFFQRRAAEARPYRAALRRKLGLSDDRPIVLFCGKLIAKKDAATLIRAMAQEPAQLLVVGDGELRSPLEALAAELLPGRACFAGFCNQSELPALYDLADLFVIPSTYEPFGLVVNEVMNAGKPVIASDRVGCWPDLVRPGVNGAVFPAGDAAALAAALRPFLLDPALCERAGQASLEIINRWSFAEDLAGIRRALASQVKFKV
jgi:glycosyltransferase involved in cell wall biosynthesis